MRDVILAKSSVGADDGAPAVRALQDPAGWARVPGEPLDRRPRLGRGSTPRSAAASRSASSTPTSRRSTRRRWCRASAPAGQASWSRDRAARRPAALPVILVGDLNSDDRRGRTRRSPGRGRRSEVEVAGHDADGRALSASAWRACLARPAKARQASAPASSRQVQACGSVRFGASTRLHLVSRSLPSGRGVEALRPCGRALRRGEPTPYIRQPTIGEIGSLPTKGSALAGGVGDEFGDFFGLLFVEDPGRHAARGGRGVDARFRPR